MTSAESKIPCLDVKSSQRSVQRAVVFSFAVPFFAMLLIYCVLGVAPFGQKSVLVLDLNAQYVYYFEQLRSVITEGESLTYTFERALGGEFMGMFAYYLSSPFSMLVALFPKKAITEALWLILLLKTGFSGLSFSFLLRRLKFTKNINPLFLTAFSTMYALSSYAVVMQHNVMWMDNVIALPLILCSLDELMKHGKFKLYVVSLVYSIMSNFYIGYMTCLFILVWFFARYFMFSPDERNPMSERAHFLKTLLRVGLYSLLAVMISAVIILPVYYSLSFGKLEFSDPKYTPKQLFEFADLLTKAFFGSYDTVRPSGMPFYYCGTLTLILAPLYFFTDKIPTRRKIGFASIMLFLIASFNFSILDIIWHGMQRPNWLNARFSYMFSALMLLMAFEVFGNLREIGRKTVICSSVAWCAALVILAKIGYDNLPDFKAVWAGILLLVLFAAILPSYIRYISGEGRRASMFALFGVIIAEAVLNGVIMLYALDDDVSYSKRSSYRQMIDTYSEAVEVIKNDSDSGDEFYRAEKLVHRKKNDNFALDIRGMSNSTSTLNARQISLLSQFGYASMSHWSLYSGANAVTDALFDIKYVMADETDNKPVMHYVYRLYSLVDSTSEQIDVYKNPYALSIAYSVNEDVLEFDKPSEEYATNPDTAPYTDPFTYANQLLAKMTGLDSVKVWYKADITDSDTPGCKMIFAAGHHGYEDAGEELTPKLVYKIGIDSTDALYAYFPTRYPRDAELKVNGKKICTYFDGEDFSMREIGEFEPGEEVEVALYLKENVVYLRSGCSFFWYFDEDEFVSVINELKDGVLDAHSTRDDKICGKINVPEGDGAVFTTIPYDEGWKITVDGEEVEKIPVLKDSLIAFRITPGEHEIMMLYKPDCVKYGLIFSVTGVAVFALLCIADYFRRRKNLRHPKINDEQESDEV